MKPTRQAKRKEADATGPQGGYGIRLALVCKESKRNAKGLFWVPFLSTFVSKKIAFSKNKIISIKYGFKWLEFDADRYLAFSI